MVDLKSHKHTNMKADKNKTLKMPPPIQNGVKLDKLFSFNLNSSFLLLNNLWRKHLVAMRIMFTFYFLLLCKENFQVEWGSVRIHSLGSSTKSHLNDQHAFGVSCAFTVKLKTIQFVIEHIHQFSSSSSSSSELHSAILLGNNRTCFAWYIPNTWWYGFSMRNK